MANCKCFGVFRIIIIDVSNSGQRGENGHVS